MRIIKTTQPNATRIKFSFVNDETNEVLPHKRKSDAIRLYSEASGKPFDIRAPYTEYRWAIADKTGASYPDDCYVYMGDSPPPDFFHLAPLADETEIAPQVPACKIKALAAQHDMRVSGTDKAMEDQFQLICTFFTRAFDEKDRYKTRWTPVAECQELLSLFSMYHMPSGQRSPIGTNFGANITTLAALYCDMRFNPKTQAISLPSPLSGRVANFMIAVAQYPDSGWAQMRQRQPNKRQRAPIGQPSIKQVDEHNEAEEERLKTKRFDDWKKRYWESPKGKEAHKKITRKLTIVANALGMTYEEFIEDRQEGMQVNEMNLHTLQRHEIEPVQNLIDSAYLYGCVLAKAHKIKWHNSIRTLKKRTKNDIHKPVYSSHNLTA